MRLALRLTLVDLDFLVGVLLHLMATLARKSLGLLSAASSVGQACLA